MVGSYSHGGAFLRNLSSLFSFIISFFLGLARDRVRFRFLLEFEEIVRKSENVE